MVKINLNQKLTQKPKGYLSLESKFFIKLIKLNINEINELLEKELNENPCVEEITDREVAYEKKRDQVDHDINNEKTMKYDEDNIATYLFKQIKRVARTNKTVWGPYNFSYYCNIIFWYFKYFFWSR